jgi:hypothetical protein
MKKLNLGSFLPVIYDFAKSQRQFYNAINYYSQKFHYYRLYPFLRDLIEVNEVLGLILDKKISLEENIRQIIQSSILVKNGNDFNNKSDIEHEINVIYDFINWAYPQIQDVVEEGKVIYNFVKQNLSIEQIGIVSKTKDKGIFIIVNKEKDLIQIYHYQIPFLWGGANSSTIMRIRLMKSFPIEKPFQDILNTVKIEINYKYPYLHNTALFKIDFDFDFPFEETVLPVAKRRLIKKLTA